MTASGPADRARRRHEPGIAGVARQIRPGATELGRNTAMIRKLSSGKYRLYSRKVDPKTGRRRNLGTFDSREQAEQHERAVQFFKHGG